MKQEEAHRENPVQENEILCWEVHLAPRQRGRAFWTLAAIAFMLVFARLVFQSPLLVVVSACVLVSSVAEFIFPVRYTLTDRGAHARSLTAHHFIEWHRVRKAYLTSEGVKLSPFQSPSRLEAFRGVFLRFNERDDEIIEAVRRCRNTFGHTEGTCNG